MTWLIQNMRKSHLGLLLAVAFLVRVIVFLCLYHQPEQIFTPDSHTYLVPAEAIIQHGLWQYLFHPSSQVLGFSVERTPLYPVFLAGLLFLFGKNWLLIVLAQVLCVVGALFFAFKAAECLFDRSIALILGWLFALDPMLILYSYLIMTEPLFLLFFALFVYIATSMFVKKHFTTQGALFLGMVLAVSTLIRPASYYLPVILLALLTILCMKKQLKLFKAVRWFLVFMLPFVVLVGGWQMRNKEVADLGVVSPVTAVNIYQYYAASTIALKRHKSFYAVRDHFQKNIASLPSRSIEAVYQFQMNTGLNILKSNPLSFLRVLVGGTPRVLLYPSPVEWANFLGGDSYKKLLQSIHRSSHHHVLLSLPTRLVGLLAVVTGYSLIIFFNFLFGVFHLGRSRADIKMAWENKKLAHLLLALIVLYFVAISVGSPTARLRIPIEPIMLWYAAFGLSGLLAWCKRKKLQGKTI